MIRIALVDAVTKRILAVADTAWGKVLCVQAPGKQFGTFRSQKFTATTTGTTIAAPEGDGSIELTDLIISFEKKTSAEVTIQFNDGDNTELLWFADLQDAPIELAVGFTGNWQGWQTAYVEVVISGAALDGSIGIGFIKRLKKDSLKYTDWDARR
ncbi:hypothetical protein LCGC14_1777470 [marine sediment metagenome]|uniref:Uncharacterized protein n=1 Tax=marine sediment metagenome TaxID=412755 RepID=A0A0F9JW24_9ZZZZ